MKRGSSALPSPAIAASRTISPFLDISGPRTSIMRGSPSTGKGPAGSRLAAVEQAVVARQVGRRLGQAVLPPVGGAATDRHAQLAQPFRDQRRIGHFADAQRHVEGFANQVHVAVVQDDLELQGGMPGEKFGDQRGQVTQPEGHGRADPERAMQLRAAPRHGLLRPGDVFQDALGVRIELLARFGHGELARVAHQQLHAKRRLQARDPAADELLGEQQLFGGSREAAGVDRGGEDANVVELHGASWSQGPLMLPRAAAPRARFRQPESDNESRAAYVSHGLASVQFHSSGAQTDGGTMPLAQQPPAVRSFIRPPASGPCARHCWRRRGSGTWATTRMRASSRSRRPARTR